MQWLLQDFEDTRKLAAALDRLKIPYSWHKFVPFIGDLTPEPIIEDTNAVVMFGSYSLGRYARAHDLSPGVFKIRPFVHEAAWHPYLLNGMDALFLILRDVPASLPDDDREWFVRPVEDSKEIAGSVKRAGELIQLAKKVLALDATDVPKGSLRDDTELMFTKPCAFKGSGDFGRCEKRSSPIHCTRREQELFTVTRLTMTPLSLQRNWWRRIRATRRLM